MTIDELLEDNLIPKGLNKAGWLIFVVGLVGHLFYKIAPHIMNLEFFNNLFLILTGVSSFVFICLKIVIAFFNAVKAVGDYKSRKIKERAERMKKLKEKENDIQNSGGS